MRRPKFTRKPENLDNVQNIQGDAAARASLELLYNIGREFAAALDLRTVLHRVLFLSMKNIGAASGSIIVLDENGEPVESAFLMPGQTYDQTTLQLRLTFQRGLAGWVARNRQAVLIPDTSKDERWLRRPDDDENRTGPKSAVSAPILGRDQLVGVITLVHPKPGFFNADHLELVKTIADQAGIAILNARLYAESQQRAKVMTAVAESATFISASLQLDEVLQRILEQITGALRVDGAILALVDSNITRIDVHACAGGVSRDMIGKSIPAGSGVIGKVLQSGKGLVANDLVNSPLYISDVDQPSGLQARSLLCTPIKLRDQMIGLLAVYNPPDGVFDAGDLLFLEGIGSLAGTSIRHAQLYESLQVAHRRYHDLFEDSIDPIFITDLQGIILEANRQAEQANGSAAEKLQGHQISRLHWIDQNLLDQALQDNETRWYESELSAQSGPSIPVQVYVRRIVVEDTPQLQWIMRDITERKNLDNMRESLIAMVYHDLRSPLANVVSSLDVLAAVLPLSSEPSLESLLNIAIRSTERIQRLTNSLLDVSRLEAGHPVGSRQAYPVMDLLQDAFDATNATAKTKGIQILIELPAILPDIMIDADMIKRVLINLVENAIKFSPTGGKIRLGALPYDDWIQFWVMDDGPGIPVADQEKIFEKYTHLEAREGYRSLGLGLAFCRLAVEGHGGRIWVESQPSLGSVFRFTLPAILDVKEVDGS